MAVGTKAGLVDEPQPQSVFKHAVLESYVPRFVSMTGSASRNRRVVVVDGFAGRGRYTGGSPASAERLLQAARDAPGAGVELVLVERDQRLYADLSQVATEYEQQGVQVITRLGDVQDHLAEVVERAAGVPLFLFLDPCGAQLPYTRLVSLLAKERPAAKWPPTEVLLNFSADLTRRAGGQLRSGVPGDGVARLDAVCGSAWWRASALAAFDASGSTTWETAAEAVAHEYGERLARDTGMTPMVVPVRRRLGRQPIYHLVFLTRHPAGLWAFADAWGRGRKKWLGALGPAPGDPALTLWTHEEEVDAQIAADASSAEHAIVENLRALAVSRASIRAVEHTREVFGDTLGVATETQVNRALASMVASSELVVVEKNRKRHLARYRRAG